MQDHDRRLDALTARVDALEPAVRETRRVADDAHAEAQAATRAHRQNVRLLTAMRETQAEHSATLAEHSATLAEHSEILAGHSMQLAGLERAVGRVLVGIHGIERTLTTLVERDDG